VAHGAGYNTCVSCEPMLDENVQSVIDAVSPFVKNSIWLGLMNDVTKRLNGNGHGEKIEHQRVQKLMGWQSNLENVKALYNTHKGNKIIQWKTSITEIVGVRGDTLDFNKS